jgi:hypothetical protein
MMTREEPTINWQETTKVKKYEINILGKSMTSPLFTFKFNKKQILLVMVCVDYIISSQLNILNYHFSSTFNV